MDATLRRATRQLAHVPAMEARRATSQDPTSALKCRPRDPTSGGRRTRIRIYRHTPIPPPPGTIRKFSIALPNTAPPPFFDKLSQMFPGGGAIWVTAVMVSLELSTFLAPLRRVELGCVESLPPPGGRLRATATAAAYRRPVVLRRKVAAASALNYSQACRPRIRE